MVDHRRRPAAVLWDMDGTLVDTEPYWIAEELDLAHAHGAPWTDDDAMSLVGQELLVSGAYIKRRMGLEMSPAEIVDTLLDGVVRRVRQAVPWRPGARELLDDLREHEIHCALVTMSYRRFVEPILTHLPDDTFTAVVTGDEVRRGKPDPEPYLEAARLLGVAAEDCVAIEDSGTGATSAETAGCRVLVVPHHIPVPPGDRRVFRDTLAGLGARDLALLSA